MWLLFVTEVIQRANFPMQPIASSAIRLSAKIHKRIPSVGLLYDRQMIA